MRRLGIVVFLSFVFVLALTAFPQTVQAQEDNHWRLSVNVGKRSNVTDPAVEKVSGLQTDFRSVLGFSIGYEPKKLKNFHIEPALFFQTKKNLSQMEYDGYLYPSSTQAIFLDFNGTYDFNYPLTRRLKIIPYLSAGVGLARDGLYLYDYYNRYGFSSNSFSKNTALGLRGAISKNVSVGAEYRQYRLPSSNPHIISILVSFKFGSEVD